jgi:hypothetical protein
MPAERNVAGAVVLLLSTGVTVVNNVQEYCNTRCKIFTFC